MDQCIQNIMNINLDLELKRSAEMIKWMIDGQFIHGISPMMFPNIRPEDIERIYNVEFSKTI